MKPFEIAVIGCGFICDYYLKTLENYPRMQVRGVWDIVESRRRHIADTFNVPMYDDFDALLADDGVTMVLNLTNPRSHYELTKACLLSGKHVYSEKPLAMDFEHALELYELAEASGLKLGSAPCSQLSAQARTLWDSIDEGVIGTVYHFSGRLHEGLLHLSLGDGDAGCSPTGTPWPWKDELEVGCTLEHAGYYLTWLTAMFGPIATVVSQAAVCVTQKNTVEPLNTMAPDFSSAVLTFESGLVGTLSCSIVMPHDRGLTIVGEKGTLSTDDCWDYHAPVFIQQTTKVDRFIAWLSPKIQFLRKIPGGHSIFEPTRRTVDGVKEVEFNHFPAGQRMDFARGPYEMLMALEEGRECRIPADQALHINEVTLAIQYPDRMGYHYETKTRFKPVQRRSSNS